MSKKITQQVYLGLGSNLGQPLAQLGEAIRALRTIATKRLCKSRVYHTAAWGVTDQPPFLNQVVALETTLGPFALLDAVLEIEQQMGRIRRRHWGERIIDIDILSYGPVIVRSDRLQIPHPYLAERQFVLTPLQAIAPGWIHPVDGRTVAQLRQRCPDGGAVVPLDTGNAS